MRKYIKKLKTFDMARLGLFMVLVIYAFCCFMNYRSKIFKIKEKYVDTYLEDLMEENNAKIQLKIEEKFSVLETIRDCIESVGLHNKNTVENLVHILGTNEKSSHSFVAYPDGTVIGYSGIDAGYVNDEYFKLTMEGERRMSDIYVVDGQEYIRFSVPIMENNKVVASLQCAYNIEMFHDLIENGSFNKKGSTFVIQRDGSLITRTESTDKTVNMFDSFTESAEQGYEKKIAKMIKKIESGKSGVTSIKSGKYKRFICYSNIDNSDWCLMTIVSENAVDPQSNKIISANNKLTILITVGMILFIFGIVFVELQERKIKSL